MSSEQSDPNAPLAEISQGPSRMEEFLDRNQKSIIALAILIALATAAFVIYRGVEKSRQETAGAEFSQAESISELNAVLENHPNTQAAQSAAILLANQQWADGDKEQAILTLQSFISEHPEHPATPTAQAGLAAKWMVQGEADKALELFRSLADNPQARHLGAYALICIGDIAMAGGDSQAAEDAYNRAVSEYSQSNFSNTAQARLNSLNATDPVVVEAPAEEPESAESSSDPVDVSLDQESAPQAPATDTSEEAAEPATETPEGSDS